MEIYKTLWGVTEPLESLLPRLRSELGYAGVEACLLYTSPADRSTLLTASQTGTIKIILMLQTIGKTVEEHLSTLEHQLEEAIPFKPRKINIHGGQDFWSFDESSKYFNGFLALQDKFRASDKLGDIPMLHETHRGRILYSPWSSLPLLKAFPSLLLTADLSHWVVVAERYLDVDFAEVMQLVSERTLHIHTRPSSTQHIQLQSLTNPMYADDLNHFLRYWKDIFTKQCTLGNIDKISIDPEFGPFPYALLSNKNNKEACSQSELDADIDIIVALLKELYIKVKEEAKGI